MTFVEKTDVRTLPADETAILICDTVEPALVRKRHAPLRRDRPR